MQRMKRIVRRIKSGVNTFRPTDEKNPANTERLAGGEIGARII
jgi:hypothetical protein